MIITDKVSLILLRCPECERERTHQRIQHNELLTMICCFCDCTIQYASPIRIPLLDKLSLAIHNAIQEVKLESS